MSDDYGEINPAPTQFGELNRLLRDLTLQVREILADNLVGVYLQGSFALGDGDLYGDCDFLIPIRSAPTSDQETRLRRLHSEIPTRPEHWAHHLEGSYPPAAELRSLAGLGRNWLYIDHGWRDMQWSTHCNNEVFRWTLRERGVRIIGPAPNTLVDVVPAEVLQDRMRAELPTVLDEIETWISLDVAWGQRYAVATIARMLYSLDTGQVTSKRGALRWGQQVIDPAWSDLLGQALADRSRGYDPSDAAGPGSVARTRAFASYAAERGRATS